ncbi:MAG: hypothetical protein HQ478_12850 [Chloroflexi bacterium]|nr:hypothetical protein [Chloroflexota bacterium]
MESLSVLLVRIVVGVILGLVGAFIGMLFNGLVVPSPAAGDELAFFVRMLVLGFGAAGGALLAWFSLTETRVGTALTVLAAALSGTVGALIAYFIGDAVLDHPDLYILNQRLTQVVIFGAVLGANASNSALGMYKFRGRRSSF